jgi:hypothetical protein
VKERMQDRRKRGCKTEEREDAGQEKHPKDCENWKKLASFSKKIKIIL